MRKKSGNSESLQTRTDWRNSDQLVTFTLSVFVSWFIDYFASVGTARTSTRHYPDRKSTEKWKNKIHQSFWIFILKNLSSLYGEIPKYPSKWFVDFCWQIEAFNVVTQTTINKIYFVTSARFQKQFEAFRQSSKFYDRIISKCLFF